MLRRDLLVRAGQYGLVTAAALLGRPQFAEALGGTLPPIDQPAPQFRLPGVEPGDDGEPRPTELGLDDYRGRWLVLYFYPRDFTGGCTLEARGFQRDLDSFHRLGAEVVGVSADDEGSHSDFCSSEGLAFPPSS